MRTGCFVCNRKLDKFYLLATPNGKKYKVCARCMNLAKAFAATTEEKPEENVEENDN